MHSIVCGRALELGFFHLAMMFMTILGTSATTHHRGW